MSDVHKNLGIYFWITKISFQSTNLRLKLFQLLNLHKTLDLNETEPKIKAKFKLLTLNLLTENHWILYCQRSIAKDEKL